jgi:hypothetical protein
VKAVAGVAAGVHPTGKSNFPMGILPVPEVSGESQFWSGGNASGDATGITMRVRCGCRSAWVWWKPAPASLRGSDRGTCGCAGGSDW